MKLISCAVWMLVKGAFSVTVIVNVPPTDDEQVAKVLKNRKTGKEMFTGWMTICL